MQLPSPNHRYPLLSASTTVDNSRNNNQLILVSILYIIFFRKKKLFSAFYICQKVSVSLHQVWYALFVLNYSCVFLTYIYLCCPFLRRTSYCFYDIVYSYCSCHRHRCCYFCGKKLYFFWNNI